MLRQDSNKVPNPRCVNLDWLEIHCIEASCEMNAAYFSHIYHVEIREYGTPQYREMFTIFKNQIPFIEIRRDPYSLKRDGGIFELGACHLRLTNNVLYRSDPVKELREFLLRHRYRINNITRLDIALDFLNFDYSYHHVQEFIRAYFEHQIVKINQSNIAAHGKSQWDGNIFNSIKWGSLHSNVNTKLYNKSMELGSSSAKDYIRRAWINSGFHDISNVWRIEFSLKSFNVWADENGEFFANDLRQYDTRDKLLQLWSYLLEHYFHFKEVVIRDDGTQQRKDRCPDVPLFNINNMSCYQPRSLVVCPQENRTEKLVKKYLEQMQAQHPLSITAECCRRIIKTIDDRRILGIEYFV